MRFFSLFSIFFLIISCSDLDKKVDAIEQKGFSVKINDYLTVNLKVKVLEDDVFELFYAEDSKKNYTSDSKVSVKVKGDENYQNVTFILPKRVYPLKIRLDLGVNKQHTSSIEISELQFTTGKNSIKYSLSQILDNFRFNSYIKYESEFVFSRNILGDNYDPFMLSGDLNKELTILFNHY